MGADTAAVFANSAIIFALALSGSSVEKWGSHESGVSRGLWANNILKKAQDTDGIELVRGTSMIAVIISFLLFVFAALEFIKQKKTLPKKLNCTGPGAVMYMSGTVCFYALIAASIYSSFNLTKPAGQTAKWTMGPSCALYWTVFCLSFLQTGYTVWKHMKTSDGKRTDVSSKDENQERGNWDNHSEYLLSMIGYAVGLGNVWRFPYLCYENGGGAFLIPYVIMLVFVGLPVFYMECAVGQFDSRGPIESWNISPAFRGVGAMMVIYSAFVGIYYNVIIAYAIYYFFASLTSTANMPWEGCDSYWTTGTPCTVLGSNTSSAIKDGNSPAEFFFAKHVLNRVEASGGVLAMDMPGSHDINYKIVISLMVAWTVVFFSLIRGIKSSGKVVWFTAIFPYVVILILLIRGCTLPGAKKGIDFYIGKDSDFSKLKEINVWRKAATQIFFSLSAGWGGVQALSSYNNFHNNCYRDSLIVAITNCLTSVVAGFAIFSVLGYMATELGTSVPDVVKSSFGLAFIAYPTAMAQIPGGPFWACLFFLMLFTLGLDSQFTILETVATALCDYSKKLRHNRTALMGGLSIFLFLLGLLCCTRSGYYWVDIIDSYVGGWAILMSTLMEVIILGSVYGGGIWGWVLGWRQPLCEDVEMMIGKQTSVWWFFWRACWYLITPGIMLALLIGSWVQYSASADYPSWAHGLGWLFVGLGLICLPIYMVIEALKARKEGKSFGSIFKPNAEWGPDKREHRELCDRYIINSKGESNFAMD